MRRPEHAITVQTMIIDIVGTKNVALELGIVITGANLVGARFGFFDLRARFCDLACELAEWALASQLANAEAPASTAAPAMLVFAPCSGARFCANWLWRACRELAELELASQEPSLRARNLRGPCLQLDLGHRVCRLQLSHS